MSARSQPKVGPLALVTVFDELKAAAGAVVALHEAGFSHGTVELVTLGFPMESGEVETPADHKTTASTLADAARKWGGIGLGAGATAGVVTAAVTTFPGIALGMIVVAGVTGAFYGGVAGIANSIQDDTVDLPTPEEYEKLLRDGNVLVVVSGTDEEITRARDVIAHAPHARSHIHALHGHDHHVHPAGGHTAPPEKSS